MKKFKFNGDEADNQSEAIQRIIEIGDEYNINTLVVGAPQFADWCDTFKVEQGKFTVDEFNAWKDEVADTLISAQIEAERSVMAKLLLKKGLKVG